MMFMQCFCVLILIFLITPYVVGNHLICIDKSMQFNGYPQHMPSSYKEVDKKYTGCNLKNMELLDCVLLGVCAVIRSNTVLHM